MFCFALRQGLVIAQAGLKLEVTLLFLVSKVMKLQTGHHCAKLRSDFFFFNTSSLKAWDFKGSPQGSPYPLYSVLSGTVKALVGQWLKGLNSSELQCSRTEGSCSSSDLRLAPRLSTECLPGRSVSPPHSCSPNW